MKIEPKALLDELCKSATLRKAQSLHLVFEICREQAERGSDDYSIVTIGRISSERGGPSAAAIRNKPGEEYRALIKAYASSVDGKDRKKRMPKPSIADELLEGVNDSVLKIRIKLILAENESLRAQLLAARHLANQTAVLDFTSHDNSATEPAAQIGLLLTLQEVTALEESISQNTMSHWGWSADDAGRVTTESGQVVFRAGFVSAIRKTVGYVADF
jgi:hypothetical protein